VFFKDWGKWETDGLKPFSWCIVLPKGVGKNQSKAQVANQKNPKLPKIFCSFSHIELREPGIENQEPFSTKTHISAQL